MKIKPLVFLLSLLVLANCQSITERHPLSEGARDLRMEAYQLWQKGLHRQALQKITQAIEIARHEDDITIDLIEGYDDAGLYYFELGDFEHSVHYQSIAVLLAIEFDNNSPMNAVYLKRLGWAFSRFKPDYDFSSINENPEVLLCDGFLNLRQYPVIKKYFYNVSSHAKKKHRKNVVDKKSECNT